MTALGNTMGGDRPRNADDAYYTPDALALAITARLRETIGPVDLIVEPSAGGGAFVRAALKAWPSTPIVGIEPNATNAGISGAVSLLAATWEDAGAFVRDNLGAARFLAEVDGREPSVLILGNPPFLLAEEHVRIALDRLGHGDAEEPKPRHLCFLLRASFLAGAARSKGLHMTTGGLRYVWHVAGRPSFTGNGKTDGAEYCVCTWQAGYRGPYEGGWLTWKVPRPGFVDDGRMAVQKP